MTDNIDFITTHRNNVKNNNVINSNMNKKSKNLFGNNNFYYKTKNESLNTKYKNNKFFNKYNNNTNQTSNFTNNYTSNNMVLNYNIKDNNTSNTRELVKFYSYSDAVNVNNIDSKYTNIINPDTNFYNYQPEQQYNGTNNGTNTGTNTGIHTANTSITTYANKLINIKTPINATVNTTINNVNNVNNVNTADMFCSNCGNAGHLFKMCQEPVISYGLICFYKKKTIINDNALNTDFFNKRTKKNDEYSSNKKNKHFVNGICIGSNNAGNNNKNGIKNNIPKIRILKRHEVLTHTLKNMLGITGIHNTAEYNDYNDELESVVDVEEIIDMDNEYSDNNGNNNGNTILDTRSNTITGIGKEIITEKIIMIQRRNTIGFIEFIRGKYDVTNHDYVVKLFNMMTFNEKRLFREYDNFDIIRTIIGLKRDTNYKLEYDDAKKKYNDLRNHQDGNMIFKLLDKSYTKWTTPEWGIPKGRRNYKEYDIECAVREFVEETGIKNKHINVYRNVKPLEEIYKGINGVVYKHIYYLANIKDNDEAKTNIEIIERGGQINHEVSNVKLFGLSECQKIIRPYYISKLNVIKKGFQLINSMNYYFE